MKILFLTHYFPPEVNAPASRTFEHARRWVEAGHDVTVITCNPNCPTGKIFDGYKNRIRRQVETVDGIKVVRVWSLLAANKGMLKRALNYFSFMISAVFASLRLARPDVCIATTPQPFCGWAGRFVSWVKRVPFVLEIRDIWPDSIMAVDAMQSRSLLKMLARMESAMYRSANHVITVGDGYREHIQQKVPSISRVDVITNGVNPADFQPEAASTTWRSEWKADGRFVCAYVGTIGMAHGLDVVLRTAVRLREAGREDILFVLVGDGAERANLEAEAERHGVQGMIHFAGRLPRTEMPHVLASVDATLVHLRGTELFESVIPSKIFEAMAMQRPIIMGVKGQALNIVLEAEAGLPMTPDSDEELSTIVTKLADDREASADLGRSGRAYVDAHYNRDRLAMRYLDLLAEFLGEQPSTQASQTERKTA